MNKSDSNHSNGKENTFEHSPKEEGSWVVHVTRGKETGDRGEEKRKEETG